MGTYFFELPPLYPLGRLFLLIWEDKMKNCTLKCKCVNSSAYFLPKSLQASFPKLSAKKIYISFEHI